MATTHPGFARAFLLFWLSHGKVLLFLGDMLKLSSYYNEFTHKPQALIDNAEHKWYYGRDKQRNYDDDR